MSKPVRRNRRPRLHLDCLEGRALPSGPVVGGGGSPVYVAGGWLYVLGTNAANDQAVVIDTNPAVPNSAVVVTLNGVGYGFNKAQITNGVRFYGHNGNDSFGTSLARPVQAWGGDGNDTLNGSLTGDTLRGEGGADQINGSGGNDSLYGGSHNDTITGGSGNDYVTGQSANDDIDGGTGNDRLYGYTGNDTVVGGDGNDTLSGWDGADDLYGGTGHDRLYAHDGNDYLSGQDGNDTLDGGEGDDELFGGNNNDTMYGQSGDDYMSGGGGADHMQGGGWDDDMHGGDGDDFMTGQSGHDVLYGDDGHDDLYGYTGNDLLVGGDGNDYLSGWDGNDLLYGREGDDDLYAHGGRDGLMGGNGDDHVSGGSDSDRYLTIGDHAEVASMSGGDATIGFGGPKLWTYSEIEMVAGGLAKLHHRTGNTVLLADPQVPVNAGDPKAPRMTLLRDITDYDVNGDPWGNVGTNNGNGTITLYDSLFDQDTTHPAGLAGRVAQYTIHEIGHNWDSPTENLYTLSGENVVEYFRADSGWRNDLGEGDPGDETVEDGQTYVKAGNSNNDNAWWYLKSADFVTDYARVSPAEDFADTLAVVVMGSDFYRNDNDTPDAPTAKLAWIIAWLNSV